MTEITLFGMRFHVRVGVLPHEQQHAQPLLVSLTVRRRDDAGLLDYRDLHALVAAALEKTPLDYLETIATDILGRASSLAGVSSARVSIRKPHVMLDGPLDYAEVVMDTRDG